MKNPLKVPDMATWGNPDGLTRKFCNLPGGEVIELPLDKDYEGKLPEVIP